MLATVWFVRFADVSNDLIRLIFGEYELGQPLLRPGQFHFTGRFFQDMVVASEPAEPLGNVRQRMRLTAETKKLSGKPIMQQVDIGIELAIGGEPVA